MPTTIMAEEPAARPSIPSVKLAPFDTATIMKTTIGIKNNPSVFFEIGRNPAQ